MGPESTHTIIATFVANLEGQVTRNNEVPVPTRVIFNDRTTIVFWEDGTKTVVRVSEDDTFCKETGVAMAYMKKIYGGGTTFKKAVKKLEFKKSK
jgi:hypothetical protein